MVLRVICVRIALACGQAALAPSLYYSVAEPLLARPPLWPQPQSLTILRFAHFQVKGQMVARHCDAATAPIHAVKLLYTSRSHPAVVS